MSGKIDYIDIEKILELEKRKAELELRLLIQNGTDIVAISNEIEKIKTDLKTSNEKLEKANSYPIVIPHEKKIAEYLKIINESNDKVAEAIKQKNGRLYEVVSGWFKLIKNNYGNRTEVAKINLLIRTLANKERDRIIQMLKEDNFKIDTTLKIDGKTEAILEKLLARFSNSGNEVAIMLGERRVWVERNSADLLKENFNKIKVYTTKMHVLSAEKQRGEFNELKENEFMELQREYLKILKEQDGILKDFNEEMQILSIEDIKSNS